MMEVRNCRSFQAQVNHIGMDILEHGFVLADREWCFCNINSPFNRLYIVLEGEGSIKSAQETVLLRPGHIYLIPLHSTCDYLCNSFMRKFYIHFRSDLVAGMDLFHRAAGIRQMPMERFPVDELMKRIQAGSVADILWGKGVLLQMLAGFSEGVPQAAEGMTLMAQKYGRLFNLAKQECSMRLSIAQAAAVMNMPPSALTRAFKQDMGLTVKEYLNRQIENRAKELLLLQEDTVKQIAWQLGFSDEFYFSRFFKRHTGLSPRDYRERNSMKIKTDAGPVQG